MDLLRFVTLLLAALGLAPGAAHVLEMPVKMNYPPELYAAVTSTLYVGFGLVGGAVQALALLAATVLVVLSRRLPGCRLLLLGASALAASLVIWGAAVAPVNVLWADVVADAPDTLAPAYAALRPRWEWGHVAAFSAWLTGFCLLLWSVLRHANLWHRPS